MFIKICQQKTKFFFNIFSIIGIFFFFEAFLVVPLSFGFISYWLSIFSSDQTSFFETLPRFFIIHTVGILFIWAGRSFTGGLFRAFYRLFALLFIFSYIEKSQIPVPVNPGKDADDALKLEYAFHPYNLLEEKSPATPKESVWESFKGYISIVIVVIIFYWLVKSELGEYILPQDGYSKVMSYILAGIIQVLMILLPSSKIQEKT